jgi:hypothetical protein
MQCIPDSNTESKTWAHHERASLWVPTNTLNMISVNGNKEPTLERAMHYYIEEVSHRMV